MLWQPCSRAHNSRTSILRVLQQIAQIMTDKTDATKQSKANNLDAATLAMQPTRPTEVARLRVAQLTVETGLSLTQVFQECSRIVAETLKVARVGVWLMTDSRASLRCATLYEIASKSFGQGVTLRAADFPIYFEALRQRKIIPAEMAQYDPMTSELVDSYLRPLGISSTLDAPILLAGEVSGVLCCEHVGDAREWTTEERDFVESVANIVATKMRAIEVQQLRSLLQDSEDRIAHIEKSNALARMAVGIAHDFRNILTVVQNCTEILSITEPSPSIQKHCDLIKQAVDRGTQFVKELAEFGRSTPTKPTVVDVKEQINTFLPIIRAAVGKTQLLNINVEEASGKILIDRSHLERILLNLVLNAKDASQPGGTIEVLAKRVPAPEAAHHDRVCIEIRDHGSGMSKETKDRLFEPYFTTKASGTGLGMPIVARFVEHAAGSIEVDSTPGVGTTIRLLFPLIAN